MLAEQRDEHRLTEKLISYSQKKMKIYDKLDAITAKNNSLLCIGLDPVRDRLPEHMKDDQDRFFAFNKAIVDATHDLVCCFKPNTAFYEAHGSSGIESLKKTCDYIRTTYPEIVLILDPKRGDIGKTNEAYARFVFEYLQADCSTLQSYFGGESLEPFLGDPEKGAIIMCKNSNPDSGEFQDLLVDGVPLYQKIAEAFTTKWNTNNNVWLVIGATYPSDLARVRKLAPEVPFLVPGVGTQQGSVAETVQAGVSENGDRLVVSSSSGIIFASDGEDFAEASRAKALELRDELNRWR